MLLLAVFIGCNNSEYTKKELKEMNIENPRLNDEIISWGKPDNNIMCGLSFKKIKYKAGESIDGLFYIKNISKAPVRVLKQPTRLRDWTFIISGPQGGNYRWKGPVSKYARRSEDDFIWLKPDEIQKLNVSPNGYIDQSRENIYIPGKYNLKISIKKIHTGMIEIEIRK